MYRQFCAIKSKQTPTLALLVMLALSGCAALPQPEVFQPTAEAPDELPAAPPDTTRYRIKTADLEIHTYRAGWQAGRAHNHVMETTAVSGEIYLAEPIEVSKAIVYFRPWDLILDDPASRAAAGEGFESKRSAADIEATRLRMLGPKGFDTNNHPFVYVHVAWSDRDSLALEIEFRGSRYPFTVPADWTLDEDRLELTADFELTHAALGIEPYSAFAGALAVAEEIRVQISLSAEPAASL
ncbi:MAG: hypothetical protein AAGE43_06175 [Pseudomonadota bacterium]